MRTIFSAAPPTSGDASDVSPFVVGDGSGREARDRNHVSTFHFLPSLLLFQVSLLQSVGDVP